MIDYDRGMRSTGPIVLVMIVILLALAACAAAPDGSADRTGNRTGDRTGDVAASDAGGIEFFDLGTGYDADTSVLRDRGQRRFRSGDAIAIVVYVRGHDGDTLNLTAHEISRAKRDVRIAELVLPARGDGAANIVSQTFRYTVQGEYPVELLIVLSVGDEQRFQRITVLP